MERGDGLTDTLGYNHGLSLVLYTNAHCSTKGGFDSFEYMSIGLYGVFVVGTFTFIRTGLTGFSTTFSYTTLVVYRINSSLGWGNGSSSSSAVSSGSLLLTRT